MGQGLLASWDGRRVTAGITIEESRDEPRNLLTPWVPDDGDLRLTDAAHAVQGLRQDRGDTTLAATRGASVLRTAR
ncbi:hypothetical protein ACFC08_35240, partial [Streptomyces sp. NPDC056112]|uniref:hypothetical protein n=1 Tax=Streptomyces sp. NPDC056112 TaxID=3345715 RepID=UPI0035E1C069